MVLLYLILLWATVSDVKTFRIPNQIIWTGYGGGFLYQTARQIHLQTDSPGGLSGFEIYSCLSGIITVSGYLWSGFFILLLLIPMFRLRVIGGGDVKLFSVCAVFTGLQGGITIILYSFIFGAVISIFYLAYRRFFSRIKKQDKIHFSIPILLGTVAYSLYGGWIWQVVL